MNLCLMYFEIAGLDTIGFPSSQELANVCIIDQTGGGRSGRLWGGSRIRGSLCAWNSQSPTGSLLERAIAGSVEGRRFQGITREDFIRMLDSDMRISDFLDVAALSTGRHAIRHTVKLRDNQCGGVFPV